jgi:hypothetical protein
MDAVAALKASAALQSTSSAAGGGGAAAGAPAAPAAPSAAAKAEVDQLLQRLPHNEPGMDAVKKILSERIESALDESAPDKSALPWSERFNSWVNILRWTPAANLAQTRNLECKLWCKRMELVNIKYKCEAHFSFARGVPFTLCALFTFRFFPLPCAASKVVLVRNLDPVRFF